MEMEKTDLMEMIHRNLSQLHQGLDLQRRLLASILGQQGNEQTQRLVLDAFPSRSREEKLKEAIREAVEELEESRKAFKSKRLEALRKKLTQALMDAE
jgi:predicted nucleotide-binding protein (sugar kinase/HSP70/actin superfamily)